MYVGKTFCLIVLTFPLAAVDFAVDVCVFFFFFFFLFFGNTTCSNTTAICTVCTVCYRLIFSRSKCWHFICLVESTLCR